jgi:hypothetical protein
MRKLKTIAKRLLRELERTMSEEHKRKIPRETTDSQ